jgi:hypothetical protein
LTIRDFVTFDSLEVFVVWGNFVLQ